MANPSKRMPWVVEMKTRPLDKWFPLEAFKTKLEAEAKLWQIGKMAKGPSAIGTEYRMIYHLNPVTK